MTDNGKKQSLLEKKLQLITNDLFKLVATDLLYKVENEDLEVPEPFKTTSIFIINQLEHDYKNKLHELRKIEKEKSKQLEL